MALPETPYCSVAEADVYLGHSTIWNDASTSEKEIALFWGKVWIDANFDCAELDADPTNPSDTIKYANALLAEDYLEVVLIGAGKVTNTGIKKTRYKAGSVEQEIEYFEDGIVDIDPQEDVKLLLGVECRGGSAGTVSLTRD